MDQIIKIKPANITIFLFLIILLPKLFIKIKNDIKPNIDITTNLGTVIGSIEFGTKITDAKKRL